MQFIEKSHERLADYARECFSDEGRGVIRVSFPDLPPGTTAVVSTSMVYHTLEQIERVTAGLKGSARAEADILIRMIKAYDPSSQAVVTAAVDGENPITIRMRLDRPSIVDEPGGVH